MERFWQILLALTLIALIAIPVFAGDRLPLTSEQSYTHVMRTCKTHEDTFTITNLGTDMPSYMVVYESDSNVYLKLKSDQAGFDTTWVILAGQYYPDPNRYMNGDTIVVRCSSCNTNDADTATVRIRIYYGGVRR